MSGSNKITKMARELLMINEDFPFRLGADARRISVDGFEIYTFTQAWGSTALGFDGIGGQTITEANTYVLEPVAPNAPDYKTCHVYFAGRYAYSVPYGTQFCVDLVSQNMAPVSEAAARYGSAEDE